MDMEEMVRQLKKACVELEDCSVCLGDAHDYFVSVQRRVRKLTEEAEKQGAVTGPTKEGS